jgi:hypothetical protein
VDKKEGWSPRENDGDGCCALEHDTVMKVAWFGMPECLLPSRLCQGRLTGRQPLSAVADKWIDTSDSIPLKSTLLLRENCTCASRSVTCTLWRLAACEPTPYFLSTGRSGRMREGLAKHLQFELAQQAQTAVRSEARTRRGYGWINEVFCANLKWWCLMTCSSRLGAEHLDRLCLVRAYVLNRQVPQRRLLLFHPECGLDHTSYEVVYYTCYGTL